MKRKNTPAIIIVGPTAIGKTELALQVAERFSCEIVGVDSMQVYRHLDVGTAKPTPAELARVKHHLVDIVNPDDEYTAGRFVEDALAAVDQIIGHDRIPLLVGGTGLYLKALLEGFFDLRPQQEGDDRKRTAVRSRLRKRLALEGHRQMHEELRQLDPPSADRIHPHDSHRLLRALEIQQNSGKTWTEHLAAQKRHKNPSAGLEPGPLQQHIDGGIFKVGLTCSREYLYERINRRVDMMLAAGLLDEVKKLLAAGYHGKLKALQAIGYRHMVNYLEGALDWQETVRLLARDTRRYAKRQYTWFRRDQEIRWYDLAQQQQVFDDIARFLENIGERGGRHQS